MFSMRAAACSLLRYEIGKPKPPEHSQEGKERWSTESRLIAVIRMQPKKVKRPRRFRRLRRMKRVSGLQVAGVVQTLTWAACLSCPMLLPLQQRPDQYIAAAWPGHATVEADLSAGSAEKEKQDLGATMCPQQVTGGEE